MGTQTLGTLEDADEMEVTEETETDQDFVPPTSRRESRSRTRGSRKNINPLLFAHSERRRLSVRAATDSQNLHNPQPSCFIFLFSAKHRETRIFAKSNFI